MSVVFDKEAKTITIHTDHTTYQMKIGPCDLLIHTYYGPYAEGDMGYTMIFRNRGYSGNPYEAGNDRTISPDTLMMEYPCEGSGDYRPTALGIRRENGVSGCDLRYVEHSVKKGKYALPDLPTVYADEDEAETLTIKLRDESTGVDVYLEYGIIPKLDVITRAVRVCNNSDKKVVLENAASLSLDIIDGDWDLMHFYGRHCGERTPERIKIAQREIVIGSRRGTSSHQHNPFVILAEHETTERAGACIGAGLMYSGSFSANASRDQFGTVRLLMGVLNERFDYELEPGEVFISPEAYMAYSSEGMAHLSHILHEMITQHVCRGPWKNKRRPVLINNWEATEMDFTGDKILSIASQAAELGVEMMVLDDGWFGDRADDNAGLGDWVVNKEKLGCSMGELADKIRGMGMKFGLWIEPEMVNEDSELYRTHPEWAFTIPGKNPVRSRNQLVLDFSDQKVVDAVFDQIAEVLDECKADYVKMDMNRSLCDVYSAVMKNQSQGKVLYRYTLGVYHFMARLLERYPDLLLEGCSGGGGRFDAGMLYYCPQIWCSDNTDAIDRIHIQYGTSFAYPVRTMGAHVSAVPSSFTGRMAPINTRAVVAMAGTFGYELDLNLISEEEKQEVRQQIKDFKKYGDLLHEGLYYRLTDVMNNHSEAAWMMVAKDGSEALLNIVTLDITGNGPHRFIRCQGLTPGANYRDEKTGIVYPSAALLTQGFPLPYQSMNEPPYCAASGEYEAFQIHLKKI